MLGQRLGEILSAGIERSLKSGHEEQPQHQNQCSEQHESVAQLDTLQEVNINLPLSPLDRTDGTESALAPCLDQAVPIILTYQGNGPSDTAHAVRTWPYSVARLDIDYPYVGNKFHKYYATGYGTISGCEGYDLFTQAKLGDKGKILYWEDMDSVLFHDQEGRAICDWELPGYPPHFIPNDCGSAGPTAWWKVTKE